MNARDLVSLIHLAGFATGAVLYAMLGVMTRRRLSNVVAANDRDADSLTLVAAVVGLLWNLGAGFVFAVRDFGSGISVAWPAAVAYTALGFLPAVVVHAALRRGRQADRRWLVGFSYAASVVAGLLHAFAAATGEPLSRLGLLLLTVTYLVVLGVLVVTERGRPGFHRTITAVALAAFAISALHLSQHAGVADQDSWWVELIGHHASLPLALAILYQNHRFAFADLFLKRALALLLLVAMVSVAYASLSPLIDPHAIAARRMQGDGSHLIATGALLTLWIATAWVFPAIQRRANRFVDQVVLRRADYRQLRTELAQQLSLASDPAEALTLTCTLLARALHASAAKWAPTDTPRASGHPAIALDDRRMAASIGVPTALAPRYDIHVAELVNGRTLLSDDLALIDAVAAAVGRRLDELWLERERVARARDDEELRRLAAESELRALRAQLNPHFLFNALNTLGHLVQSAPDRALTTLYRLTGLLRAVLGKNGGQFVTLGEELEIVESYLAIEHERFGERLTVVVDVPADLREVRLPPLLLQPLVENAVKHGVGPLRAGGTVTVSAWRDEQPGDSARLHLVVSDTGQGMLRDPATSDGVGLANIASRLRLYFGADAQLATHAPERGGTSVEIWLPWSRLDATLAPAMSDERPAETTHRSP